MSHELTRVELVSVQQRINVYLRFGEPALLQQVNANCRYAFFAPESVFGRVWWERNRYGTTRWTIVVLQAGTTRQHVQSVVGVMPGAVILLRMSGAQSVRKVLRLIQTIESRGIAPARVSPSYWRTVFNRFATGRTPPFYGWDRHVAELARRSLACR